MARFNLSLPGASTDFKAYDSSKPTQNQEVLARALGKILWDLQTNSHQLNADSSADISTLNTAMATWLTDLDTWNTSVMALDYDDPVPDPPTIPAIATIGDIGVQILYYFIKIMISIILERLRGGKDSNQDLLTLLDEGLFVTYDGERTPILHLLAKEDVTFEFVESGGKIEVHPFWNAWDLVT